MRKLTRQLYWLILWLPTVAWGSGIYNPGSTGGGGGSGGYALQPATVTIVAAQGVTLPDNTTVSTGAINLQQVQSFANAPGIQNGNFLSWGAGTTFSTPSVGTTVATGWVVADNTSTSGYTISQESSIVNKSKFSMKTNITGATINGRLWIKQTIGNYQEYLGSSVTVTCSLYAVNNSPGPSVALAVQDSVSGSTSTTVAVDSTWHQVSVTFFVHSNATQLSVWVGMPQNNPLGSGAFYVDNVMLVPGDTPVYFIPNPYGAIGFTDASNATAGIIGEAIRSYAGPVSFGASGVWTNITSISLTPGDWDVTGLVDFEAGGSGASYLSMGGAVSINSGNTTSDHVLGDNVMQAVPPIIGQADNSVSIPNYRINISATTTVYLKGDFNYTSSAGDMRGRISARRVR